MIRIRLNELLAVKELTRVTVSAATGISRNTLSTLSTNNSEMIRLDTIDKLCTYLEITPGEFFEFYPTEVDAIENDIFYFDEVDEYEVHSVVKFSGKNASYYMGLTGTYDWRFLVDQQGGRVENIDPSYLSGSLFLDPEFKDNETAIKYLKEFPPGIIEELKITINFQVASDFVTKMKRTLGEGRVIFDYKK